MKGKYESQSKTAGIIVLIINLIILFLIIDRHILVIMLIIIPIEIFGILLTFDKNGSFEADEKTVRFKSRFDDDTILLSDIISAECTPKVEHNRYQSHVRLELEIETASGESYTYSAMSSELIDDILINSDILKTEPLMQLCEYINCRIA